MSQTLFLPIEQVFSDLGAIGAGFKLSTFETGTSTPLATFSNTALTIPLPNPTIADSAGRFPQIFINDAKLYKASLTDADDNAIWTADPVDPKIFSLNDFDPRPTSFWGTTGGASTVYTLAANPAIQSYSSNHTFFLDFHIACGVAPTIAISGLGALGLKKSDGAGGKVDLEEDDVLTSTYEAKNDGVDIVILNPEKPFFDGRNIFQATDAIRGVSFLNKRITTANGSDANHDINFGAGTFDFDDGSGRAKVSALIKRIDANFVAGTNNGGLDTGSVSSNQYYYMFAISDSTTPDVEDFIFSLSFSSPTLPGTYDKKKYLGALRTDGSSNIEAGRWNPVTGEFYFLNKNTLENSETSSPGTAQLFRTVEVPPQAGITAIVNFFWGQISNPSDRFGKCRSFLESNNSASVTDYDIHLITGSGGNHVILNIPTDNSQVWFRVTISDGNTRINVNSKGWFDGNI